MTASVKAILSVFILLLVCFACVYIGPYSADYNILVQLRIPRVISAVIVGACLSGAGVLAQGVLRNPLADPYIMGASSGAAVGVVICFLLNIGYSSILYYLIVSACSFGAVFTAYSISRVKHSTQLVSLLLSGIMVSTFLSALILLFFVFRREQSFSVLMFMMGGVTESSKILIIGGLAMLLIVFAGGLAMAKKLDIMSLGEIKSSHLGVNTEQTRLLALLASAMLTSVAVSLAGIVSFVGLIIPHIVRMIFGPRHGLLFFMSMVIGAAFLVAADTFCRTAFSPVELPIGVVTTLTGVPFFIMLLRRQARMPSDD